jgi:hypothetical protein
MAGIFVLTWPVFGILSIWFPTAMYILIIEAILYGMLLLFAGAQSAISRNVLLFLWGTPIAVLIMHFSWGIGFIWSIVEFLGTRLRIRKISGV